MKNESKNFNLIGSSLCVLTIFVLISCETYHFAYPLPVDSKNIYKTPKKLRGLVATEKSSDEGFVLGKHSITILTKDTLKIIDGIGFSPFDTTRIHKSDTAALKKLHAMHHYNSRYTIKFDSLKLPVDTVENFILKGKKIYKIEEDRLAEGMAYELKEDTIYVPPVSYEISLGKNIFFRKVTSNSYLLNIKDNELGIGNMDNGVWWQIVLVTKEKNGKVTLSTCNEKAEKTPSLIYQGSESNYYFDSQWTRKDVLKLINNGAFDLLDMGN